MTKEYVLERVTQLRKERNWSLYRLTQEADISYTTLSNTIKRNNVPTISTILRICDGLGITMAEFFDEENTLAAQLDVSDKQLLEDWHKLPRTDKELLKDYMQGLLKLSDEKKAKKTITES